MAAPFPPADPDDPLAAARGLGLDGLLALLEQLGGEQECVVVRGALEAGVPPIVVAEELQHEVERRLIRSRRFYDETEW
jgi:hypothetical protein